MNRKEQRRNEAQERARISALSKPLKKELSKIEKELDLANKEKSALDLKLADTDFYQGNQDEVAEALKRHGELSSKIDELEGRLARNFRRASEHQFVERSFLSPISKTSIPSSRSSDTSSEVGVPVMRRSGASPL